MIRKPWILGSLLAVASLAPMTPHARAANNVVTCNPTAGLTSVVTVSPAMVNNVSPDAPLGLQLKARLDGCIANAAQLAAWAPSKLGGTVNGALIAKADVQLKTKGFGTCSFLFAPSPGFYAASGKLQVKWLDASGKTVPKTTPSSAYVRVSWDILTFSTVADGIVTKGVGVGANIHSSLALELANPINAPVLACNTGPYAGPPVTQIGVITDPNSVLSIDFP